MPGIEREKMEVRSGTGRSHHGVDAATALRITAGCPVSQLIVVFNLSAFLVITSNERITSRCNGREG